MEKTRKIALTAFLVFALLFSVTAVSQRPTKINASKAYVFKDPLKNTARENVLKVKREVNNARTAFNTDFRNLINARERYRTATDPTETPVLRENLKNATRLALIGQVSVLKKKLKELQEDETVFSEQEEILSNEDATEEELITAANEINSKWVENKRKAKLNNASAVNQKLRTLNQKAEVFIERLQALIEKLEERGKDVSKLAEALEEFKEHKEKANEIYQKVKEELENASTPEEKRTAVKHAYRLLKAAHRQLMQDFIKMKRLVNELRGQNTPSTSEQQPENLSEVLQEVENDTGTAGTEENKVNALTATEENIVEPEEVE